MESCRAPAIGNDVALQSYTRARSKQRIQDDATACSVMDTARAILTRREVESVFAHLHGAPRTIARLIYESGFRPTECFRMRVGHVDTYTRIVRVERGKRAAEGAVKVVADLADELLVLLQNAQTCFDCSIAAPASGRSARRNAANAWERQWLFPAARLRPHTARGEPKAIASNVRKITSTRGRCDFPCGRR